MISTVWLMTIFVWCVHKYCTTTWNTWRYFHFGYHQIYQTKIKQDSNNKILQQQWLRTKINDRNIKWFKNWKRPTSKHHCEKILHQNLSVLMFLLFFNKARHDDYTKILLLLLQCFHVAFVLLCIFLVLSALLFILIQ